MTCHVLANECSELPNPRHVPVDPTKNALRLVQQNPGLRTLEFEHCRRHYGLSHFDPQVLASLSTHRNLTTIKLNLNYTNRDDPWTLISILQHLPDSVKDLEFCAHWGPPITTTGTGTNIPTWVLIDSFEFSRGIMPNLRQLKFEGTVSGRVPRRVMLGLLKSAPLLRELSVSNIVYDGKRLLEDILIACPPLQVLVLKNQSAQWVGRPIKGSPFALREFTFQVSSRLMSPARGQDLDMVGELLGLSGPSLRTAHISMRDGGPGTSALFRYLKRCTQLTSLCIESSPVLLRAACQVAWREDFPHLQVLKLRITEEEKDCRKHDDAWFRDRWTQQAAPEHARVVVSQIYALFRSLKASKNLKRPSLTWNLCYTLRSQYQEAILALMPLDGVNGDGDGDERSTASPARGLEVMEFLGLKWTSLALTSAQAALFKAEEVKIGRLWRMAPRVGRSVPIQRRHGRFWMDWEALGNKPCLACETDRDPYRFEYVPCSCGSGEELYEDMEVAAAGQWYSNRKTYFKTGKSHHRHSLKHLWK
ncbi:hypothetical protein BGZ72_003580 [Mortierella alpina]|nr:hypothetical protein BGZ72_003580 [Mortierella alpina]